MTKIAIITDSDASLPDWVAQKFNIDIVSILINFGEESYTACVDIDDAELFRLIDKYNKLPTTAAPSPNDFYLAFQKAFEAGADEIVCICVSSQISATYQAALNAAEMYEGKRIAVMDSLNLSMGQGLMVIAAAEALAQNANVDDIIMLIDEMRSKIHVFAALPTLKYLAMGGWMGKLAAGVADTLNIKPVLTARDGKLELLEKVRTFKKAEERLIELAEECSLGKEIERFAMIHVNNEAGAQALAKKLQGKLNINLEPIIAEFTPGLSVHAGSGVVGFGLLTN